MAKKAIESGASHAGEKLGKKAAEKSGDFIRKKLATMRPKPTPIAMQPPAIAVQQPYRSRNMQINHLISGDGIRRRKRQSENYVT